MKKQEICFIIFMSVLAIFAVNFRNPYAFSASLVVLMLEIHRITYHIKPQLETIWECSQCHASYGFRKNAEECCKEGTL